MWESIVSVADHCFPICLTWTYRLTVNRWWYLHKIELFHMVSNSTCYFRSLINLTLIFSMPCLRLSATIFFCLAWNAVSPYRKLYKLQWPGGPEFTTFLKSYFVSLLRGIWDFRNVQVVKYFLIKAIQYILWKLILVSVLQNAEQDMEYKVSAYCLYRNNQYKACI